MDILLEIIGMLILIIFIIPLFLPSRFSMSRKIEIHTSVSNLFSKLTDLNEYVKWNPFPEGDPTNRTKISGTGLGSTLSWTGKKTEEGRMSISKIDSNRKISIKMEFFKPMPGEGMVYWVTTPKSDSSTEMTWEFHQDLSYFKRYFGLIMEKLMGKHFEKGLINFKKMVEEEK